MIEEKNEKETQIKENQTGSAYIANGRIHVFNKRVMELLDEVMEEDEKKNET